MARFGGWVGNEVAARLALVFVLGCNGDKDETGDIIPKDDADADTDADSDADADADSDSDTDVPERCEPIPVDPGATLVGAARTSPRPWRALDPETRSPSPTARTR